MSKPAAFTIQALQLADVPTVAKLSANAFEGDRQTQMKALGKGETFDMEKYSLESIPEALKHPRQVLLKAVDDATGEIMGYVNWGFRGFAYEDIPALEGRIVPADRPIVSVNAGDDLDQEPPPEKDPIKRLQTLTGRDMERWMRDVMPDGVKCIFIVGLSVSPKFQGRGAGSALLKWGTDFCDEHGAFAWVHSSEPAWPMYEKCGFEIIRTLDIDLDAYAPCPPPNEGPDAVWGHYVFRYMKYFAKKK